MRTASNGDGTLFPCVTRQVKCSLRVCSVALILSLSTCRSQRRRVVTLLLVLAGTHQYVIYTSCSVRYVWMVHFYCTSCECFFRVLRLLSARMEMKNGTAMAMAWLLRQAHRCDGVRIAFVIASKNAVAAPTSASCLAFNEY